MTRIDRSVTSQHRHVSPSNSQPSSSYSSSSSSTSQSDCEEEDLMTSPQSNSANISVVPFLVGGTHEFHMSMQLLEQHHVQGSLLHRMVNQYVSYFSEKRGCNARVHPANNELASSLRLVPLLVKDGEEHQGWAIFLDRDPVLFGCIVRLLQQYHDSVNFIVPAHLRASCRDEAHYFGLGMWFDKVCPSIPRMAFRGGGMTLKRGRNGSSICTSYVMISRLSSFFHTSSRQTPLHCTRGNRQCIRVGIEMDLTEFVGVGVISSCVTNYGEDCRGVEGTAMLYNSGAVHWCPFRHNMSDKPQPKEDKVNDGFGAGAVIYVTLDLRSGTVMWEKLGTVVSVVRLWAPFAQSKANELLTIPSVAFAVVMSGKSVARLVHDDDVLSDDDVEDTSQRP